MDKEEWLKMARDSGAVDGWVTVQQRNDPELCDSDFVMTHSELMAFASAILERAALECDKLWIEQDSTDGFFAVDQCCNEIRSLKPSNNA